MIEGANADVRLLALQGGKHHGKHIRLKTVVRVHKLDIVPVRLGKSLVSGAGDAPVRHGQGDDAAVHERQPLHGGGRFFVRAVADAQKLKVAVGLI